MADVATLLVEAGAARLGPAEQSLEPALEPALPTGRISSGSPRRAAAASARRRVAGVGRWASHTTRV